MTITITIYKHCKLLITLTEWFIWPVWRRDWTQTYGAKQIEIAFKSESLNRPVGQHIARAARTDFSIWFLCLRLHFPLWFTFKDVALIYPANYKWQDDRDYHKKYLALVDTGYFA